jgi:hypothetical protein
VTTTPTLTAAEFDPPPNLTPMVRQILDLTAQLAESERAKEAALARSILCTKRLNVLLQCAYEVRSLAGCGKATIVGRISKKLAEYDELTSGDSGCACTPGARRVHAGRCALGLGDLAADQTTARESAENTAMQFHKPNCSLDLDHKGPCEHILVEGCAEPPTDQTPEPVEPSDEELDAIYTRAADSDRDCAGRYFVAIRALYRAGLAAEAAAHAKDREAWDEYARGADKYRAELRAELERVRAELATAEANATRYYREAGELRAQARARRVPTDSQLQESLSRVLKGYGAEVTSSILVDMADAVLRLFAEAPPVDEPLVTSDNEPPVPLPEVLPVGTRTRYGSIADGAVVLKEGSHYWGWWNKDTDRERCANADQIDWSHYRAQQRAAEPTPAVTCTWAAYAGKSKVGCDQATDHPSGICDLHRKLADSFGRDVFPEPAPEAKYIPTVGERAVLVSSPDEGDADIVGLELEVVAIDPDEPPRDYWVIRTLDGGAITVHRDATWRPASAAPADRPIPTCIHADADHEGPCRYQASAPAKANESDSVWLKRTVEELTTARPVEVTEDDGMHRLEAPGFETLLILHAVQQRRTDWIVDILTSNDWPLRTKAEMAKPAEPSPQPAYRAHTGMGDPVDPRQPGGFLDALTKRVEALEVAYGTVIAKQDELRCMYEADEQAKSDKV